MVALHTRASLCPTAPAWPASSLLCFVVSYFFTTTLLPSRYHLLPGLFFSRILHETLLCRCNGSLTFPILLSYTFSPSGSPHSFGASNPLLWRTILSFLYPFKTASTVALSVRIDDLPCTVLANIVTSILAYAIAG